MLLGDASGRLPQRYAEVCSSSNVTAAAAVTVKHFSAGAQRGELGPAWGGAPAWEPGPPGHCGHCGAAPGFRKLMHAWIQRCPLLVNLRPTYSAEEVANDHRDYLRQTRPTGRTPSAVTWTTALNRFLPAHPAKPRQRSFRRACDQLAGKTVRAQLAGVPAKKVDHGWGDLLCELLKESMPASRIDAAGEFRESGQRADGRSAPACRRIISPPHAGRVSGQ